MQAKRGPYKDLWELIRKFTPTPAMAYSPGVETD